MSPTLSSYMVYLVISLSLTIWVGRTLHKNGAAFLRRVFDEEHLADSVGHLLHVGFYLVNVGFVSKYLKASDAAVDPQSAVELVFGKIGTVALVLGAVHFFNLFVLSRIWRGRTRQAPSAAGVSHETPAAVPG